MTEKGKKESKTNSGEVKSTKAQTLQIEIAVKVKIDKDCGLPEAGRMVLARHIEPMLEKVLDLALSEGTNLKDQYLTVTEKAIRIRDWSLLDLRPTKEDTQEEIPGTDA